MRLWPVYSATPWQPISVRIRAVGDSVGVRERPGMLPSLHAAGLTFGLGPHIVA